MLELSSAGISVQWASETVAGVRPTAGYAVIPSVKGIPDFNPEPSSLQTTDLSQTMFHTYISGLRDLGGALAFSCNHTQSFMDMWKQLVSDFETGKATGMGMWFAVVIPDLAEAFYFSGEPAPLGLSAIEVDAVLEIDAYIAPLDVAGWQDKHTA
jgi:hypothetical protein